MTAIRHSVFLRQAFLCWNWKCALLSAIARSLVYFVAMMRGGRAGVSSVVFVEMAYVTLTAGVYAGLQQRALRLRRRMLGNAIVVFGVPCMAQVLDWTVHHVAGAAVPARATLAVCIFAGVSAMFHLYVMRNGVFLAGHGRSLAEDFRSIPMLLAELALKPVVFLSAWGSRSNAVVESSPAE